MEQIVERSKKQCSSAFRGKNEEVYIYGIGSMAYDLFTLGLTKMKRRYEEAHAEPRIHKGTTKEPIGFKQEAMKC